MHALQQLLLLASFSALALALLLSAAFVLSVHWVSADGGPRSLPAPTGSGSEPPDEPLWAVHEP